MEPEIVLSNKDFYICHKPAGVLSQSDRSFDQDMVSMLLAYEKKKGKEPYIAIINRLDRPVEGLVLFARNKRAAGALSGVLTSGGIGKHYLAVVQGRFDEKRGTYKDYLLKNGKSNTSSIVAYGTKDAKEAVLNYVVKAEKQIDGQDYSLVEIELITGRHHQIRVQFAGHGHALYGDTRYNKEFKDHSGPYILGLCAYKMQFRYPVTGDNINVSFMPENSIFLV